MNETRELQKQDIDGLLCSLKAIERLLSDVKLLLEWRFRDDPLVQPSQAKTPCKEGFHVPIDGNADPRICAKCGLAWPNPTAVKMRELASASSKDHP